MLCCSFLCGYPAEMEYIRGEECCLTGCGQGCGCIGICEGVVCCIPDWLRRWSLWHTIGKERGVMFDIDIRSIPPTRTNEDGITEMQTPAGKLM
jgi:hypothetical protein